MSTRQMDSSPIRVIQPRPRTGKVPLRSTPARSEKENLEEGRRTRSRVRSPDAPRGRSRSQRSPRGNDTEEMEPTEIPSELNTSEMDTQATEEKEDDTQNISQQNTSQQIQLPRQKKKHPSQTSPSKIKKLENELRRRTLQRNEEQKQLQKNVRICQRVALELTEVVVEHEHAGRNRRNMLRDFMKEQGKSTTSPSGVIKKVKFFNFMCHDSFEKDWHPNLNFITGENGSGKSSILNGIIVGLGARAVVTSRTKSIKALVKEGKDWAKLEITLGNEGLLKIDKYGSEFTIQRIIDRNGASAYKIQTMGKFRPLRRAELDSILLTLGIQLDNPVSILNQETARSFLKSKDPKDKYKLFYSGTLLDKCEQTILETRANLESANQSLMNQVKLMHLHREELMKLENLMDLIRQMQQMTISLAQLKKELAWSKVINSEKAKAKVEKRIEIVEGEIKILKQNLERSIEERRGMGDGRPPQTEKLQLRTNLKTMNTELDTTRKQITQVKKTILESESSIRSSKSIIKSESLAIQTLEQKLEKLKEEGNERIEREKQEYKSKMEEFAKEKEKFKSEIESIKADMEQFKHSTKICSESVAEYQEQYRHLGGQLNRKKQESEMIKKSASNKYTPFGPLMQELVGKINANAGKFKEMPRGPLGACFTVKDDKWTTIIEHVLSRHIFSFVVGENQSDRNLLTQLIDQTYGRSSRASIGPNKRPDVYMKKFEGEPLNITAGRATMDKHPTILDVIEIEDFVVRNALIDFCSIERYLLFENTKIAVQKLKNNTAQGFPKTCKKAFSLDWCVITPAPNLRYDSIPLHQIKKQASVLKSTAKAQERNLEAEIQFFTDSLAQLLPTLEEKRREEKSLRMQFDKRMVALKAVEYKYQQVAMKEDQAKRTPYKAPDVSTFLEELEDKRTELRKAEEKEEKSKLNLAQGKTELAELMGKKNQLDSTVRELQEKLIQLEAESENLEAKYRTIVNLITRMEKEVKDVEAKKVELQSELQSADEDLELKKNEAQKLSLARVETRRDQSTISRELDTLQGKVDEIKKQTVDRDKIREDLKKARTSFHAKMNDLQMYYMIFKSIKSLNTTNWDYFDRTRKEIGNLLSGCYLGLLGPRRYKGRLIIEHDAKELYYFVCSDETANENAVKIINTDNTRKIKKYMSDYAGGLSGGERSFATICFIIAIWQVMETPFFMLDEFDVFMDAFNRKSSQAALVSHAQKHLSHQFFFFTPLDLSTMPDPRVSTILRLYPPTREDESPTVAKRPRRD